MPKFGQLNKLLHNIDSKLSFLDINSSNLPVKILMLIICMVLSIIVINQSLFYRWFGYETIPAPITDEFNYVWQGLSLRQSGLPLGWVTFSHIYKNPKYNSQGGNLDGFGMVSNGKTIDLKEFRKDSKPVIAIEQIDYMKGVEHMFFVTPFFDHPPLGGLIYSLGENQNVKKVDQVKPSEFRKPALVMAVITVGLLFIFLFTITSNPWLSTLGVIIYSTVPTYLLASRTAFLENVIPPFILTHLILLFLGIQAYKRDFNKKIVYLLFILSAFLGGISYLAKESTTGFLVGSFILMILNKLPKKIIAMNALFALLPIASYFIWGLWIQKDLFLDIFAANATRGYFGAIKLVTMLEALKLKNFPTDGWWIWGLLSFLLISFNIKQKNLLFLIMPLFAHFLLLMLIGSANYSWYYMAMIPFLAGCSAIAIWQIFENPNIATSYAFFFIAFSSSYYWGRVALNISPSITHYRFAFLIFTFFLIFRLSLGKFKITRLIWFVFLAILIYKIIIFNQVFMPYLVAHWGNLPIPSLPNF